MLCAISADKVVGWKLYPERICGVKTNDILAFYDEFIKDKYVPYHPETNAIEEYFNQLKHYIKKESPNTYDDIFLTIRHIIATKITREHLTNYLKHSYKIYKS